MDEVKMCYNPRNQLVLVQDGNLKDQTKWICNQYDAYGRPLKSGFYTGVQPASIAVDLAVPDVWSENTYDGTVAITKGKVTQTKTRVPTTAATPLWITQTMTYDATRCGQMTAMSTNNHLNAGAGTDVYTYKYDWAGNKYEEKRVHKANTSATPFEFTQNWDYDHSGRNTNYYHTLNATGTKKRLANYKYDLRDRMIERNLGEVVSGTTSSFLQSLDYTYNDLNWMTAINGAADFSALSQTAVVNCGNAPLIPDPAEAAFAADPDGNDVFKLNLFFNGTTAVPLQNFGTATGAVPVSQKNGNISQLQWQVRGRKKQGYNLTYDWLDRMTDAYNAEFTGTTPDVENRFKEKVTYLDKRGNIGNLVRNGLIRPVGSAATACWSYNSAINIDNLQYTYVTGTNRVQSIAENSNALADGKRMGFNPGTAAAPGNYAYDKNGNLITDNYKGINITYNHLNLPSKVFFAGGSTGNEKTIDLLYDFKGQKLQKKFFNASSTPITQDYVAGIEYKNGVIEAIYFPEGRIAILTPTTTPTGRYEYSIKDHLGNTRLTFADLNDNKIVEVPEDILQEQHYYPFGLGMDYTWMNNTAINDTKYLYNGKELNDEVFDATKRIGLNWNDYGARFYDSAIARWITIDPLADKYKRWSPYNYCIDNPVRFIDPNGMSLQTDYYNLNGKNVKHVEDGKSDKKLVLTDSKKESKVDEAISTDRFVDVPSNQEVNQMESAYNETEKSGNEAGFVVGDKGTVSSIITGDSESIKAHQWAPAKDEITAQGELVQYDAHTHPLGKDADGNINSVGTPNPSSADMGGAVGDKKYVVLGYIQTVIPPPSGQIGGTGEVKTDRAIGFYNSKGALQSQDNPIKFSDFQNAVKKINN
jgi:RHS repeat-associated protein